LKNILHIIQCKFTYFLNCFLLHQYNNIKEEEEEEEEEEVMHTSIICTGGRNYNAARHSLAVARSFLALVGAKCSSAFVGVRCEIFLLKKFLAHCHRFDSYPII
jgi:hypothetical protein